MTVREIYKKVSEDTGLPVDFVEKTYKGYWRAVREHISSLPLMENLSEEEFLALQPNVNIPSLGKFNVPLNRYKRISNLFNTDKKKDNASHKKD